MRPPFAPADRKAALAEIEPLLAAAPGTPEADMRDILATLVERSQERLGRVAEGSPVEIIR